MSHTISREPITVLSSIIDNLGDNTLRKALEQISEHGRELWIATAFFSLDALNMIGEHLERADHVRILFGDDACARDRNALLNAMRYRSDDDLEKQRASDPTLAGLKYVQQMITDGKLQARVYTQEKFHAKLYISHRTGFPPISGIVGSGNFTRSGLTQNIELNVHLTPDQTAQLVDWYNRRWEEAVQDDITLVLRDEIERQIKLYAPYAIYVKALLTWGDFIQGREAPKEISILPLLDPHQEHAYRQVLRILQREPGAMLCDGVGLGKSFVALALMEHWLSEGSRVLLVAPKAILKSSWEGYLYRYLRKYSRGYANVVAQPMTWFGFDPETNESEQETLEEYAKQADVIIIDESHNFRTSSSQRYKNLYEIVAPNERGRKKIVLLSATPINTRYEDLTNQLQLLTHDDGRISGIARLQLNREARLRDKDMSEKDEEVAQEDLFDLNRIASDHNLLAAALESVVVQRSRKTCRELATAAGKRLRFPSRNKPQEVRYELNYANNELIENATHRFRELGAYLAAYRDAVRKAADKDAPIQLPRKKPTEGLKFSGYLPNIFLKDRPTSKREYQVEAFLAGMMFTNVMKQLESSAPAFRSIILSLGNGLALRLRHFCGDDIKVKEALELHASWLQLPENPVSDKEERDNGDEAEDGVADEASGGETDDYVCREERRAIKRLKDLGFSAETHNIPRWRDDILNDLNHLKAIYQSCQDAMAATDTKLEAVTTVIRRERAAGRKVLVFTQSRITADYVQKELQQRLSEPVAMVNSTVGGETRAGILHSFSPRYNDPPAHRRKADPSDLREVHVLVSTDVLAEGVNLQEAGCIISYDIHWNPTRLIQRIGRVDRRLREEDPDHSFDIYNVFPPPAIDDIIGLVQVVESRTRRIDKLLGIDVSFFKSTDEDGTLKEFNKLYEGESSARDEQLKRYVSQVHLDESQIALADQLPLGALGVWDHAPINGLFALFTVTWRKPAGAGRHWLPEHSVPDVDQKLFGSIIGTPKLFVLENNSVKSEAPAILEMLSGAEPTEKSGLPTDINQLQKNLKKLREHALAAIPDRTRNITVELLCWMELKKQ